MTVLFPLVVRFLWPALGLPRCRFSVFALLGILMCGCGVRATDTGGTDAAEEQGVALAPYGADYLAPLARDTWNYIARHIDARTGFPTDSQKSGGETNTTNIGLYLACLGPAVDMGLIGREAARARAEKVLRSLGRLEHKNGFLPNWVSVAGDTKLKPGICAVSDFNKLQAGLILARQHFPELAEQADPLVERVEWNLLYDPKTGLGHYGFDLEAGRAFGSTAFWLASDNRLSVLFMIASGGAPAEFWDRMERRQVKAEGGLEFLWPGYEVGGLFMQALDGIFLEERGGEMGRSVGDLAWHQILLARSKGLAAWGWSNCNIPGKGYTEGGFLPWWVVTPHASALVVEYYPRHVVANLRALEAMGARRPLGKGGRSYGFRDSIDLRNGMPDDRYLLLDQAMLFLSLVNYLEEGAVRQAFARDALVAKGLQLLGGRLGNDDAQRQRWAARDALPVETAASPAPAARGPTSVERTSLDLGGQEPIFSIETGVISPGASVKGTPTPEGLLIDFDLGPDGTGEVDLILKVPPVDIENLSRVTFLLSGKRTGGPAKPYGVRVYLRDDQKQGRYGFLQGIAKDEAEISLNDSDLHGILAKPGALSEIMFKFWGKPWYFSNDRTRAARGQVLVKKIVFETATPPK